MKRTFIWMSAFEKAWKALGLGENERVELEEALLLNPKAGAVIEGSGGVRKMRFAFPGKGKSGSVRVIYVDVLVQEAIYMLYAYPKSVKENLTKKEVSELKKMVDRIKG